MKKRTRNLKVMSILMSVLLILNSLSFYAVAQDTAPVEPEEEITTACGLELKADNDNIYKKIHFYLGDSEEATIDDADELAKATSKLQQRSDNLKEVQVTVQFESDFMNTDEYKAFAKERETLNSIEEVRDFRVRLNSYSKEYHAALATKGTALLGKMEYNSITPIEYSPFVVMKMDTAKVTASNLASVAEYKNVVSISVDRKTKPVATESWGEVLDGINAADIVWDETYTGWGIRIGILEANGVCDINHPNLRYKNITVREEYTGQIDEHATKVTSVLATIAPNAVFFVSKVNIEEQGIAWFISQGCDIVNCSYADYADEYGNYLTEGSFQYKNSVDGVFDYQILAHFITVVVSAGNKDSDNNGKLTSPGYAYNAITVGGVKKVGNAVVHHENACYDESSVKPNISAYYSVAIPNMELSSGTSFTAPQVAGCVAVLMESDLSYTTYPERIQSVLMSTAKKTNDYDNDVGNFDEKVGAGVVDLQRMVDSNLSYQMNNWNSSSRVYIAEIDVYLTAGQELQAALAWLVRAVNTSSSTIYVNGVYSTNYQLMVRGPSGSLVTASLLGNGNVEMIRLTAPTSGTYQLVVLQASEVVMGESGDWISLTYNVTN